MDGPIVAEAAPIGLVEDSIAGFAVEAHYTERDIAAEEDMDFRCTAAAGLDSPEFGEIGLGRDSGLSAGWCIL